MNVIDFDFSNNNQPEAGSLLISEPFLADQYFTRSVIYLCEHNDNGSFGFVLNKYIDYEVEDLLPNELSSEMKISIGGPVDGKNLFFVHSLGDQLENAIAVDKDIFIGGDFEKLKGLLKDDPNLLKQIRFFIGYSGWSPGQLQDELEEKSWIVLNGIPSSTILSTNDENLWKTIMSKLGGKFKVMSEFPVDPNLN